MLPTVWGKHLWFSIHFIALDYPGQPGPEHIEAYGSFFNNLWKVIPCYKCAVNYKRHLAELPVEGHLQSRDTLFAWTVSLHNIVNKELGKPQMNLAEARQKYMDPDFNLKMCQTVHVLHNMHTGNNMKDPKLVIGMLVAGLIAGALVMFIIQQTLQSRRR